MVKVLRFNNLKELRVHYGGGKMYTDPANRVACWNQETQHWDWWYDAWLLGYKAEPGWVQTGSTEQLTDHVRLIRDDVLDDD